MKKHIIASSAFIFLLLFSCGSEKSNKTQPNEKIDLVRIDTVRNTSNEIERVESYFNNKRSRISFYTNNQLVKVLKYIEYKGRIIPNELFIFDAHGDTLKEKSLYHIVYFKDDTISTDEEYNFKIVLEGHLFDSAYLALSVNVNDDFPIESDSFPVLEMKNFEGPALAIKGTRKGWNYIKGRIDNVRNPKQAKDQPKMTIASIYFVDSFYVE